jgi:hypothetical protein
VTVHAGRCTVLRCSWRSRRLEKRLTGVRTRMERQSCETRGPHTKGRRQSHRGPVPQHPEWREKTYARGLDNSGNIEGTSNAIVPQSRRECILWAAEVQTHPLLRRRCRGGPALQAARSRTAAVADRPCGNAGLQGTGRRPPHAGGGGLRCPRGGAGRPPDGGAGHGQDGWLETGSLRCLEGENPCHNVLSLSGCIAVFCLLRV